MIFAASEGEAARPYRFSPDAKVNSYGSDWYVVMPCKDDAGVDVAIASSALFTCADTVPAAVVGPVAKSVHAVVMSMLVVAIVSPIS